MAATCAGAKARILLGSVVLGIGWKLVRTLYILPPSAFTVLPSHLSVLEGNRTGTHRREDALYSDLSLFHDHLPFWWAVLLMSVPLSISDCGLINPPLPKGCEDGSKSRGVEGRVPNDDQVSLCIELSRNI